MDRDQLRDHLARLRAELTRAHQAAPESKQSLTDAMQDVHSLIDQPKDAAVAGDASLPERLENIAVQFEANHPTLAASARRLIDLLSEVGI